MPAEKKWVGIQALRALSILLIVLSHLTVVEVKFGAGSPLLPPFLGRGTGGLALFFIISGLMMVTITRGWFHHGLALLTLTGLAIFFGRLSYRFLEAPLVAILRPWGRGLGEGKTRQNLSFI